MLPLLLATLIGQPFSPARAQAGRQDTPREEKMTPEDGCIRVMTEHRLYITEGRIPTDNTLEAALLCARASPSLCERAMGEIKARPAPVWAKYMMSCAGK